MLFNIDIWHNIAYCVFRIANERTSISLLFEMATDGSAAYSRRIFVRCGSKRGTIHASCGSGGQPACPLPAPRLLFRPFCPKSVPERFDGFRPAPVKPGQGQSNLALPPGTPPPRPETPNPRPETRKWSRSSPVKPGQGQSRSVKPGPQSFNPVPPVCDRLKPQTLVKRCIPMWLADYLCRRLPSLRYRRFPNRQAVRPFHATRSHQQLRDARLVKGSLVCKRFISSDVQSRRSAPVAARCAPVDFTAFFRVAGGLDLNNGIFQNMVACIIGPGGGGRVGPGGRRPRAAGL